MSSRPPAKTIGLKVISVIFAVLLWLYVANQGELTASQDSLKVQLQYRNLTEGFSVKGPEQVYVKLWGTARENRNIMAYVDMAGLGQGSHRIPVKVEPVAGVILTSVRPKEVDVVINKLKEETIPVKSIITRKPPSGYELLDVIIEPDKCMIRGEQSAVQAVAEVVAAVDLGAVRDFTTLKVPLQAKDAGGRVINQGIRLVPDKITVYAVIGQIQSSKKVKVKTPFSGTPELGYQLGKIEANVEEVTVLGSQEQLEGLEEVSIRPVDLTGKKESFEQDSEIVLPTGLKAYPARVLVSVEIKKDVEKEVVE
ncbi:MAG: CdaR family protein [Syntrophomonas sp.]